MNFEGTLFTFHFVVGLIMCILRLGFRFRFIHKTVHQKQQVTNDYKEKEPEPGIRLRVNCNSFSISVCISMRCSKLYIESLYPLMGKSLIFC